MPTARQMVLTQANGTFEIEEVDVPTPRAGEFLLRTEYAGVCGTDTHIYKGEVPGIPYPVVLGHEFVGTVEAIGRKPLFDTTETAVREGDRVVPMPATPCGECYECVVKPGPVVNCPNYDVTGFSDNSEKKLAGGLSEVIYFRNPRVRFFKTEVDSEIAVLAEPFCTPIHGVQRVGIRPGDTVLVQGSGTVGLLAVAAAFSAGASRVFVIGGPARRLEIAKRFGVALTIDISEVKDSQERIKLVKDSTLRKQGVDVVIEAAGAPSAVPEGIECLRNGGSFCELGHFSDVGEIALNPYRHFLNNNISLIGSSGYGPLHFMQALALLEQHAFPYEDLITHKLPLARAGEAVKALSPEGGWTIDGEQVAKILVDPRA